MEKVTVAVADSGGLVEVNTSTDLEERGWLTDKHPSTMMQQKLDRLREEYVIQEV